MNKRVVITGVGIISPLGDSSSQLHARLCEGSSAIKPIDRFTTDGLRCREGGQLDTQALETYLGRKNLRALDHSSRLLAAACGMALADAGWDAAHIADHELGLVAGTMFGGMRAISEFDRRSIVEGPSYASAMDFANTVINAAAGQTAIRYNLRGINSTIAAGPTSGLRAVVYAADYIRMGRAAVVLAAGVDELCFESFYGLARAGLLCGTNGKPGSFAIPFDRRRNGFALSEGAAVLVLEDAESAAARGADFRAEIAGHGSGYDRSRGTDSHRSIATVARCMLQAIAASDAEPGDIHAVSASANGSVWWDQFEACALEDVFGRRSAEVPITAIKSCTGESLAASGPVQLAAMIESLTRSQLPGIRGLDEPEFGSPRVSARRETHRVAIDTALINAVGFDGNACSVLLRKAPKV